ncbi:2-dehydro-3-deoxy-phosphogluconate aldolase [Chelativorans salis]|uniref:2-dehydro-3-deoxy-phosphogluconate aldolase n=1 Tax=Chelativorans salis TaxID=2978478 RepID=A0ABT2LSK2_9HYPH|nr:2-dehydro-3-deoxy-phosphogluconate aldolase [Chelativorans sp. EGI FJ00035]MCT7377522.1 2-dehydro-3-deoxy-phosphogluconate aldolase [Chelativorans sp. EGI FJ00035]
MKKRKTEKLLEILSGQPVIPVLRIDRIADAVPLTRALAKGGLPAVEITLRTPDALDAIRLVVDEVPEAIVGAGTILTGKDFAGAAVAGAQFIVSPGTTQELLDAATRSEVPFLPGAVTPSEVMAMRDEGYEILKFFPAEQAGGAAFLKSLASPLPSVRFCPTGGISPKNAADYLSLPNVVCIGGSWVAPDAELAAGNWQAVEELAREAAKLARR